MKQNIKNKIKLGVAIALTAIGSAYVTKQFDAKIVGVNMHEDTGHIHVTSRAPGMFGIGDEFQRSYFAPSHHGFDADVIRRLQEANIQPYQQFTEGMLPPVLRDGVNTVPVPEPELVPETEDYFRSYEGLTDCLGIQMQNSEHARLPAHLNIRDGAEGVQHQFQDQGDYVGIYMNWAKADSLVPACRSRLQEAGLDWVVENKMGLLDSGGY